METKKEKKSTKISVILTLENFEKMESTIKHTGMSRTEYINRACEECVVVGIAETANLSAEFAKIREALWEENSDIEIRKVGKEVCQSFALLMEKIEKLNN